MPTQRKTLNELALRWKANVRTVARWSQQGAPLQDEARMRVWLSSRKHLPPGTRELIAVETPARRTAVAQDAGELKTGAAAALTRLESSEATAFRQLEDALKTGDPAEIKFFRDSWLRIGDSLRKYDIAVAELRRDSGDLIPRIELERLAGYFTLCWKGAAQELCNSLPQQLLDASRAEMVEILHASLFDQMINSFTAMAATPDFCPPWLIRAAVEPIAQTFPGAHDAVAERSKLINEIAREMGPVERAARAAWNPNTEPTFAEIIGAAPEPSTTT